MAGLGTIGLKNTMKVRAALVLMLGGMGGMSAARLAGQESGKLAAAPPVTYDNRYEIYGGIEYMNFQAGQNVNKLFNLGGAEISGTYWITSKWGAVGDYRGAAGTSFVEPNPVFNGNALVYLNSGLGGVQYRVAQNQRVAFSAHALGGVSHGTFDETLSPSESGFYTNGTKPIVALGGSLDFNRSKNFAIRFSPDLLLTYFGNGTSEFFSVSAGIVYRFGTR